MKYFKAQHHNVDMKLYVCCSFICINIYSIKKKKVFDIREYDEYTYYICLKLTSVIVDNVKYLKENKIFMPWPNLLFLLKIYVFFLLFYIL